MGLFETMQQRSTPVRAGVIGAGTFATMFLHQAARVPNLQVSAVVDLSEERGRAALDTAGLTGTRVATSVDAVLGADDVDVVVEATGSPVAGAAHALGAIEAGQHVVMVTVEADVLVGPVLAARAADRGVVYTMASGDQPSLVCELVDWARTNGFAVVAAGKGTKYLPEYHRSTPETVWGHYGFTPEHAAESGLNPVMFNSFLDGTKSAIEMAAVANATGLLPPEDGLAFPPAGTDDLQQVCIPREAGGVLDRTGTVEVVSSLHRDGRPVDRDLRWGVYVTLEAPSDYVAGCFANYGLRTDPSGRYTAMYRPYHLIGLELAQSVCAAGARGADSGRPRGWVADVVATAKRDLVPGDRLDGEGGSTVHGVVRPAAAARTGGFLPIGLADGVTLRRAVAAGAAVTRDDLEPVTGSGVAHRLRAELEAG
ncbi:NAD(P)H-dependent oxidoreductase [Pseudonocardia alni]|uniref:NAD(P)H-dependent oxidoreductase n=1 Tax=Pseudonocardia alni TaxID=33907 RepID=UPI001AD79EE3|nr:Gfo/Idh/MocA family oxidoreductase [Pseudonocardia alni]MBO4238333.1 Gfo/Idh/MocA family oxidoreductase [Pseudonocardia alni]